MVLIEKPQIFDIYRPKYVVKNVTIHDTEFKTGLVCVIVNNPIISN